MSPPSSSKTNPYENPELWRWTGSMEGVPDWVDPAETEEERAGRAPWQTRGNELFGLLGTILPGVAVAAALALVGRIASDAVGRSLLGLDHSPISPILVAILAGLAIRNTIGVPAVYEPGLALCLKRVLRVGVALLGVRLSLDAVGSIGLAAVPIVLLCILTALLLVAWISRALGLPARLGTLIAVGTAICGNTAIVATGPVIGADEDEVSYAVGTITVFGLVALVTYPFLSHWIFQGDASLAGYFLGTAIHDTAQVAGAGLLYLEQYGTAEALDTATVTKLVRNLFMLAVIPLMAYVHHRSHADAKKTERPTLSQLVPLFVFGFLAMAVLRSVGDLGAEPFGGLLSAETWERTISGISTLSSWCLVVAMASVGLGTNLARLRTLGLRPLAAGLAAAAIVGAVSVALVKILSPWILGA